MKTVPTTIFLALAALSLAACGRGDDRGAGGVTAEEERALDNAAAMLEENVFVDVAADGLVANEAEILAEENAAAAAEGAEGNAQ